MSGDPKVKRSLFQTSYTIFSVFYTKSIFIKSQIWIIGGLRVVLEIQIEGLNLEFQRGRIDNFVWEKRLRRLTLSQSRPDKNMLKKSINSKGERSYIHSQGHIQRGFPTGQPVWDPKFLS